MIRIPDVKYYRFFFMAFFAAVAYLAFRVISPLLDSVIMGAVMGYLFYPIYLWVNKAIKRPTISAFIVCILIVLLSSIPLFILGKAIVEEAKTVYISTKHVLSDNQLFAECKEQESLLCQTQERLKNTIQDPEVRDSLNDAARAFGTAISSRITKTLYAVPDFILFLFVSFFVSFYLFIDGPAFLTRMRKSLPIKVSCQELILSRISSLVRAVVFGSIILALIQGILGAIGFLILGLPQPLLWGMIMSIVALIPYVGTALVWGPAALWLVATGSAGKGLFLALYGTLIISTIDNLLKPLIIGASGKVHPLMALLGVLGGIAFLGPLGFIVGPIILASFEALLEAYELEKGELL